MAQNSVPINGPEVRSRREALFLTQDELAGQVGITPNTLWQIEAKPDYTTSFSTIKALAKRFKCDPSDLLPRQEEIPA